MLFEISLVIGSGVGLYFLTKWANKRIEEMENDPLLSTCYGCGKYDPAFRNTALCANCSEKLINK